MNPELTTLDAPFTVAGPSARTLYQDEINPATARLPGLWAGFFAQGMGLQTLHRTGDPTVYGVYSDYESDAQGHYTCTAGVRVWQAPAGLHAVTVPAGRYLVFRGQGPMPQTLVQTWAQVWGYFQGDVPYARAFTVDFEAYTGPDGVAIHIAVHD
ncbi:AraC family transcriptional regulator [Corticibacter populi]|uniref:AraC family transcriptional regulator n=1 Tax=Corticibacter populi TaxID=1550736 RepID=A0A3M6QJD7_9BURK|nr:GyrI-like domain-containing protein [Corticibacter populi]RMX02629.1 AraC family transcriptional regulator [Corticibacter populi]RZS32954.1 putative transcriptional regulator YdeE [Corticibacter populi]